MTAQIDLNCDIGEGFGRWRMPYDAELMELVTTVNVAAGFHAGDPTIIRATVDKALSEGVDIGVHVALPDLLGFGRRTMSVTPAEVRDYCTYQIGAVAGFVTAAGGILTHVKPHGALYAMASQNPEVASAIARSIREYDPSLRLFLLNERCAQPVHEEGVTLVTEGFPELHYDDEGQLSSSNATRRRGTRSPSPDARSRWPKALASPPSPARTWTWTCARSACTATPPTFCR